MKRGFWAFVGFSAAVFAAVYLLPHGAWLWAAPVPAALSIFCFLRRHRRVAVALLGAALALVWSWAFRSFYYAPAADLAGHRTKVTVTLADYPEALNYGARAEAWLRPEGRLPVKVLFYAGDDLTDLVPGDELTVTADCASSGVLYGEEVDYYTSRGIFLLVTARGSMDVRPADGTPVWALPTVWAKALRGGIRTAFPGDVSGFLTALVTGDRSGLGEDMTLDLARTGTSHVVAVSGMHVCFLMGLITLLVGHDPRRRAAIGIPVLAVFLLMVGATPSVVRASVMQFIVLLAPLLMREEDSPTSVAFALFFLLVLNPFSCSNVGLQLSFAAVVGIRVLSPRLLRRFLVLMPPQGGFVLRQLRRVVGFLWTTLATTLGAMAFTLPLSLLYFRTLSFVSPLVNLLILPGVTLLFALALLLGLLGVALPGAAAVLGAVCAPLARYVTGVVARFSAFPYAAVHVDELCFLVLVIGLYALLLIALLWTGQRRRVWPFLASAAAMAAGALLLSSLELHTGALTVSVLDVGQGQSVAVSSKGVNALVDCGSTLDDAGNTAADYFLDRGVDTLDLLVLTHFHFDHAAGVASLFRRMEVKAVAVPDTDEGAQYRDLLLELAEEEGCPVTYITRDTSQTLGDARLTLYAPLGDGDANEEGLSALVSLGDFDLLITGDMNTIVEERLVKYGRLPDCEVLVAGHHGSRYASGDVLLEAIRPEAAVISVGYNTYGHPAQETLERLERWGAAVYRTDQLGTVTLRLQ